MLNVGLGSKIQAKRVVNEGSCKTKKICLNGYGLQKNRAKTVISVMTEMSGQLLVAADMNKWVQSAFFSNIPLGYY